MVEKLAVASVFSIIMVIFLSYLAFTGYFAAKPEPKTAKAVATCLAGKDAVVYISTTCGACTSQKEIFGEAFTLLRSMNCADDREACAAAGIAAVPTWVISGEHYEGVRTLEELAELAGC